MIQRGSEPEAYISLRPFNPGFAVALSTRIPKESMMATMDPLQQLQRALSASPDSQEQAELLTSLREALESQQAAIPILCTTLIPTLPSTGDSLLKRWVLELLHFGVCRSSLGLEERTKLSLQCLEMMAALLMDPSANTVKIVIQIFAGAYPLLFRFFCSDRVSRRQWDILTASKARILAFLGSSTTAAGVKLCTIKFMQRVILVQTPGVSDPRLQNKADPNLSFCPTDHPFIPSATLEAEGQQLVTQIITMLYSSQNSDILSAILNTFGTLAKMRPVLVEIIVSALAAWTPSALTGQSASAVRSVEKAIRILLVHISRTTSGIPFTAAIHNALHNLDHRMRLAKEEEARRATEVSRKRALPPSNDVANGDTKRPKMEHVAASISAAFPSNPSNPLASFDFTTLPASLVTDLVIGSLQALSEQALNAAVQAFHHSIGNTAAGSVVPPVAPALVPELPVVVKQEPVDPLKMDIDEEELEYQPDQLNEHLEAHSDDREVAVIDSTDLPDNPLQLADFKLPAPRVLSDVERDTFVRASLIRIRNSGGAESSQQSFNRTDEASSGNQKGGIISAEMWMLLLVRVITRGLVPTPVPIAPEDHDLKLSIVDVKGKGRELSSEYRLRQTMCDYIMENFSSRARLATIWMNEEWYNDRVRLAKDPSWQPNYDVWVLRLVAAYNQRLDSKDKMFSRFLLDLPTLPPDVLGLLRELCIDPDKMQAGFSTLRELVALRPPLRKEAMTILLELTTHPDKVTRGAAIITVKRWVPDSSPMDIQTRAFALQMLRRLKSVPPNKRDIDQDEVMRDDKSDGEIPDGECLHTPYLPVELAVPAQKSQVLQHVELLFALSVKVPDFLDEIFMVYGQMEASVQEAVQDLITALIRSLGSNHGKLLTLLRTFPSGAESLALRVLNILTESGRPSAPLVALVKSLITERDLKAPFLIPIIGEMDKADILKHLPLIVSMLNGKPEEKNLVRSVFSSIVTTPPQSFGSVSSNLPRVRQSELLTPAELMVLLHDSEKEIGLKAAIEAIGICFSMTDVYRSEVIAVVMQQIVDEPVLPVLFMRTVIQAVSTYKSLIGFVSTTLLSRLITKKIWTNPPLWEGFGRCAKQIAPASFGALLQLPKEQLRELVDKYPGLKSGLRDFVIKKAGNKARVANFLEVLGGEEG